ncbi:flippase-like domain-containing protein [Micromonospora terminaliae]|uniref:Flippase-like domain-containing protein n=1 Tax=Micromonospora terminaliae TaxID=1914461 RepID=A0AAJ3DIS3_9ACTN|nr:lysylphosphatidylglycerol synthase transmembrane domain-containing protein [Micromonospora terminaliae]NES28114.1 flippase-like domain-containing protein [Micromonospora terminaliae]QGL47140.1 flippase-like domain-containing protein [Micromonospora terminaliae]
MTAVAVLLIAALALRHQLHYVPRSLALLTSAAPGWLAGAAVLSIWSVVMLAEQQRRLLRALGTRMSPWRAVGIAYAQSSVAITVPGGSAVATAFTVRQLRAGGASLDAAVATVALSGAASVLGLMALCLPGAVLAGVGEALQMEGAATIAVALAITLALPAMLRSLPPLLLRYWQHRTAQPRRRMRAPSWVVRRWWRMGRSRKLGRDTFDAMRRLREQDWYAAVAFAVLNWFADACCLAAVARSMKIDVELAVVGTAYLAVQAGKFISPIPGGLGVAEPTLVMVLCAAGVDVLPATSTTLVYRAFSYWAVALVGLPLWLRLHRRAAATAG